MSNWIPVSDRLPSHFCGALVFVHRRITCENQIGHCECKVSTFDGERFDVEHVTHWMPLPEVPEDSLLIQTDYEEQKARLAIPMGFDEVPLLTKAEMWVSDLAELVMALAGAVAMGKPEVVEKYRAERRAKRGKAWT